MTKKKEQREESIIELTTTNYIRNILGNLSLKYTVNTFLAKAQPEQISAWVLKIMIREVDLFIKKTDEDGETSFMVDSEGKLISRKGAIETDGVLFADFQAIYDACQRPMTKEEVLSLFNPLQEKYDLITQNSRTMPMVN